MSLDTLARKAKIRLRKYHRQVFPNQAAPQGHPPQAAPVPFVDALSDQELAELNRMLDWQCFVSDHRGRRFGNVAWSGKRSEPQVIPDRRITMLHERFDLSDKHVLEIGCFEGIHTIGLARYAKRVTAVDARIENVVKTIVRTGMFGVQATVFKCDVEAPGELEPFLAADWVHHVGVLYHLKDPVRHLMALGKLTGQGIMLDTHVAAEAEATERYSVEGREVRFKKYMEYSYADVFSGMYDHAKWLRLEDLIQVLKDAGFPEVEVVEERAERNGPRVLIMARKA